jgi:hypothetical protein
MAAILRIPVVRRVVFVRQLSVDSVEELIVASATVAIGAAVQRGESRPLRLKWRRSALEGG